ncbi:MAG TPA: MCE family protein [Nitriliruptorales bacterium]|nr:MCE family protein [Nitriliruptorales bacterium]
MRCRSSIVGRGPQVTVDGDVRRPRRDVTARRLLALLAALTVAASGCARDDHLTLEAEFSDVIDLVERAPVFTADVRIGTVTGIELTDRNRARVTMEVRGHNGLPSDVEAVLKQTSLLGERMVELVPQGDSGRLSAGVIEDTDVQTDLEDVVRTGNDLLAFVAADRLNAAVHAGAVTFAGRGGTLGQAIADVETFVGDVEEDKGEVLRLLDGLDALLATLASEAETNAQALESLARSSAALTEEDDRLLDALGDLRELGGVGERILRDNREQLEHLVAQLRTILDAVTRVDGALQGLLTWLPRHNLHVPNANQLEFLQIWLDLVGCGTSSEDPDNPAKSCTPPNPGRTNQLPPGAAITSCDERADGCRYGEHGTHNEPNDFGDGEQPDGTDGRQADAG